jgi:EAL domain-containing protein (putative c-di-GMP-specific phosphodiesterase class I)
MVPPMRFIPTAEKCGLIVDIGRWVLNAACQQLARWDAEGLNSLSLAVNVSACQLGAPDFLDSVCRALNSAHVAPHRLELEITESAALEDVVQSTKVLQQLADMGVRLVIDDFGAGYSSLNRLKHMPIHALKIDRFFLNDIVDDPRDAAIVLAIVGMAHSLGISVVAEGIERIEQLEFLRGMRWDVRVEPVCDRAQGFLIAKPLPAPAATKLLRDGFSLGCPAVTPAADRVSGLEARLHLAP